MTNHDDAWDAVSDVRREVNDAGLMSEWREVFLPRLSDLVTIKPVSGIQELHIVFVVNTELLASLIEEHKPLDKRTVSRVLSLLEANIREADMSGHDEGYAYLQTFRDTLKAL